MAGDPTERYLRSHAEPEASAVDLPRCYQSVLVVPAFDESPDFVAGLMPALQSRPSVCVVVVNAATDVPTDAVKRTRALARELSSGSELRGCGRFVDRGGHGDLFVIDRASSGVQLPAGQGVGTARKIGCDWALAAIAAGAIASPWIHTTDADAVLDPDYFAAADAAGDIDDVAALTYPFWHLADSQSTFGRALEIYEASLHYYVLGLAHAGSPYAFHSIGSTIAVRASSYAIVRGVPRRQAGEDFYLLNKLAKEGRIATPATSTVRLLERETQRTPFGTAERAGAFARELLAGRQPQLYHPAIFSRLRELLSALQVLAADRDLDAFHASLSPDSERALTKIGAVAALQSAFGQAPAQAQLEERVRRWFDGFRTLRFVHELERAGHVRQPWQAAIEAAPFAPPVEPLATLRTRMATAAREVAPLLLS